MKFEELLYDPEDAPLVASRTWGLTTSGHPIHWASRERLHNLIMEPPPGRVVDHKNGNPLDNRRANLRIVSPIENCQNLPRPRKNNQSGYRGVHWEKRYQKWYVSAKLNGKLYFIGRFKNVHEAGEAARMWRLANMPGALS